MLFFPIYVLVLKGGKQLGEQCVSFLETAYNLTVCVPPLLTTPSTKKRTSNSNRSDRRMPTVYLVAVAATFAKRGPRNPIILPERENWHTWEDLSAKSHHHPWPTPGRQAATAVFSIGGASQVHPRRQSTPDSSKTPSYCWAVSDMYPLFDCWGPGHYHPAWRSCRSVTNPS